MVALMAGIAIAMILSTVAAQKCPTSYDATRKPR
jgi:hypothetical protein